MRANKSARETTRIIHERNETFIMREVFARNTSFSPALIKRAQRLTILNCNENIFNKFILFIHRSGRPRTIVLPFARRPRKRGACNSVSHNANRRPLVSGEIYARESRSRPVKYVRRRGRVIKACDPRFWAWKVK
ncbi:hypothetical protein PUN28_007043 [Cardiocondyla obscurior]|uniref:Uncharacterized protein n=1 Tax=Cardiocondyla obscurior TaxID=286306 RepID=A0AAW2G446_9HYME